MVPSGKPMPYWCSRCRVHFSVKLGTVMEGSKLSLRQWAVAISMVGRDGWRGVSSMDLHRALNIRQATAWYMLQRIGRSMGPGRSLFYGPLEAGETYLGIEAAQKEAAEAFRRGAEERMRPTRVERQREAEAANLEFFRELSQIAREREWGEREARWRGMPHGGPEPVRKDTARKSESGRKGDSKAAAKSRRPSHKRKRKRR